MAFSFKFIIGFIYFSIYILNCCQGNQVIFSSRPSIVIRNGFAYIKGCEYFAVEDIAKDAVLIINDTIRIQFDGDSKQINKTVPLDIKNNILNITTTALPTTTVVTKTLGSLSSIETTTTAATTTTTTVKTTTVKIPHLTLPPFTTPKLPFRIGRSLLFFKGLKKIKEIVKEKVEETVKNILKNVLVFQLPEVYMKDAGYYRCGLMKPNTSPALSPKSQFLQLPAPNVHSEPIFLTIPTTLGKPFSIKGCVVKSNYDLQADSFIWKKNGKIIETPSVTHADGTYTVAVKTINSSSLLDEGFYQCGVIDKRTKKEILSQALHVTFKDVSTDIVVLRFNQQWDDALYDSNSPEYIRMSAEIQSKMTLSLKKSNVNAFVEFIKFRPGSVIAETRVVYSTDQTAEVTDACTKPLDKSIFSDVNAEEFEAISLDCCPQYVFGESDLIGRYTIEVTRSPQTLLIPCKYNPEKNLTISCQANQQTGAKWGNVHAKDCVTKFKSTQMLRMLKQKDTCTSRQKSDCLNVVEVAKQLRDIVDMYGVNIVEDLIIITKIASENIADKIDISNIKDVHKLLPPLFEMLEIVLSQPAQLFALAEIESGNSNALLKTLDRIGEDYLKLAKFIDRLNLNIPVDIKLDGINIAFNVEKRKKENTSVIAKQRGNKISVDITSSEVNITRDIVSMIVIPSEAIEDNDFIYSYYYKSPLLFMEEETLLRLIGNSTIVNRAVQSNVLSANVGTKDIKNLTNPVKLLFKQSEDRNISDLKGTSSCDYWDFNKATSIKGVKGGWSSLGCQISATTQRNGYFSCECDHLTNFALLLDVSGTSPASTELSIITWIGCSLSIVGLSLTIIFLVVFKEARKPTQMQMLSLSLSLLILLVIFVAGIERTSNKTGCKIIGAFVHYFLLTTFFWMCVHAVSYYQAFVMVFNTRDRSNRFVKRSLIAWGVPAIIVVITASIAHEHYIKSRVCMVTGLPFYITVVAPISAILLFNIVVTIIVIRHIRLAIHNKRKIQEQKSGLEEVRIVLACNVLMGTTWIFGLFAVKDASMVFQWLFCIFNPLQGFFIFIFFTLRNKTIIDSLKKTLGMKETVVSKDAQNESTSMKQLTTSSTSKSTFYDTIPTSSPTPIRSVAKK